MDEESMNIQKPQGPRKHSLPVGQVALVFLGVAMVIGLVILVIKANRRVSGALGLAAMVPIAAATAIRQASQKNHTKREKIDQDFLKLWLSRIGSEDPLVTPAELCEVLNILFQKDGRPEPFDSPSHMARELKKLGLQSSVRSVLGRSERRWYDFTGFGTHVAVK